MNNSEFDERLRKVLPTEAKLTIRGFLSRIGHRRS
jgi:hypothetical protein